MEEEKKSESSSEPKNRFLKLLVFLGIIFLFTTIRDVFSPARVSGIEKKKESSSILSSEQENCLIGRF